MKNLPFIRNVLLVIGIISFYSCDAGPNEKRLLHHLLDKYNILERPVSRENETLLLSMDLKLTSISYVNWHAQQIGANFLMAYEWQDVNLQWNSSEFGFLYHMVISNSRMWKPSIHLFKEATGQPYWDSAFLDMNFVRSNGSVKQEHAAKLEISCPMSRVDFPFEEHECRFEFGSLVYGPEHQTFTTYDEQSAQDTSEYNPSPDFDLLGTTVSTINNEQVSRVIYTVRLRANGIVHLKIAYLFCTIITSLMILSCLISASSPHKLSISVLSLGMSIFSWYELIMTRGCFQFQPEQDRPVRMVVFFTNLLILNLFVFISNSLMIYIYSLELNMPSIINEKINALKSYCLFKSIESFPQQARIEKVEIEEIELSTDPNSSGQKNSRQEIAQQQSNQSNWKDLAFILDRTLFGIWSLVVIVYSVMGFPRFNR